MNFTDWLSFGFMRNALVAILIMTPLFGMMGTMVVNKKMAFFSDALGHSALTGIAVGVVCGLGDTTWSMIIFAIVFALLLNYIASKNTLSTDTLISLFSSCSIAIVLAILSTTSCALSAITVTLNVFFIVLSPRLASTIKITC